MKTRLALILLPLMILALVGCSETDDPTDPAVAAYVGSATCATCHETIHDTWVESGHPYKLTKVEGEAPTTSFPSFAGFPNDVVGPPDGYTWDDISYTIGGYGWKMRWIDNDGYIITSGAAEADVQYNFQTDDWVTYHTGDEPGTKPYNCGKCHTTGWIADEDYADDGDLTDNQDGIPGMHGTFEFGGVHCEECHGPGSLHADDPDGIDMELSTASSDCGRCHTRDAENHIASSGGFIKHHEQYDEWLHSPHGATRGPGCNDCHDAHASVRYDDVALGTGTTATCESCHVEIVETAHNGAAGCVDCHMPKATKTAVAVHDYQGDIKTHIWSINTDPVGKTDGMFNAEGNLVLEDVDGQAAVTLDFACYSCHQDGNGNGGGASEKDLEELSAMAVGMHDVIPDPAYVGAETCATCHSSHFERWTASGHPYKLTPVDGAAPTDAFPAHAQFPNDVVGPPAGYTWDDVTYTIGGFGWKMRWIDNDGYIITSGAAEDLVQYNFEADAWGTYHTQDEPGTKPYNCGKCHTTGWIDDEDWETDGTLDDNQDGLEGMHGTFFSGGVECEACHGMGSQHAYSPAGYDMVLDNSSELCGQCHTRDPEHRIPASGGYIKHHEQYDEWLHSPHSGIGGPGCNSCHDSHASVKFDDVAPGSGVTASCESCHSSMVTNHSALATCTDCHMPEASKSAVAVHAYQGDIKTHIWSINTAAVGKDEMFTPEGDFVQLDGEDKAQITLDFACYSCHRDEGGIGGDWSQQDLNELSAKATGIHTPVISAK
jgi:hypothetical protein